MSRQPDPEPLPASALITASAKSRGWAANPPKLFGWSIRAKSEPAPFCD